MAGSENIPKVSGPPLDAQDLLVLHLSLDMMSRYTDDELAKARKQSNNAKQLSMLAMRQQIANARGKLQAMESMQ